MRLTTKPFHALLGLGILAACPMLALAEGSFNIKGGVVNLWDDNQVINGSTRSFDATTSRSFVIGWEHRRANGAALGMEYLNYRNEFTPPASPDTGLAETKMLQFVARKYFDRAPVVHPFLGIGVGTGQTYVSYETPTSYDKYNWALTLQANAGVEFRLDKNFSLTAEVKGLFMNTDGNHYDPSGTGAFLGMGVIF